MKQVAMDFHARDDMDYLEDWLNKIFDKGYTYVTHFKQPDKNFLTFIFNEPKTV